VDGLPRGLLIIGAGTLGLSYGKRNDVDVEAKREVTRVRTPGLF